MTRAQKVQGFLIKVKSLPAQKLAQRLSTFIARTEQVIDQTKRRIFDQEKVPSHSKIVSIFEPHTDIICRGKVDVLVEFGHKVWLDEVDGGMVSDYRVLQGNPHDSQQLAETINQHIQVFGRPPRQVSADRGVYSQFNENLATQLGVKRVILPKPGHKSNQRQQQEKKRSFVQGRRWHNGIEGRISVLKRCFGLERCLYHGEEGFERWVAWGVMAHNLTVMGRSLNHLERCQS